MHSEGPKDKLSRQPSPKDPAVLKTLRVVNLLRVVVLVHVVMRHRDDPCATAVSLALERFPVEAEKAVFEKRLLFDWLFVLFWCRSSGLFAAFLWSAVSFCGSFFMFFLWSFWTGLSCVCVCVFRLVFVFFCGGCSFLTGFLGERGRVGNMATQ